VFTVFKKGFINFHCISVFSSLLQRFLADSHRLV
jgi:hypothetical protein